MTAFTVLVPAAFTRKAYQNALNGIPEVNSEAPDGSAERERPFERQLRADPILLVAVTITVVGKLGTELIRAIRDVSWSNTSRARSRPLCSKGIRENTMPFPETWMTESNLLSAHRVLIFPEFPGGGKSAAVVLGG